MNKKYIKEKFIDQLNRKELIIQDYERRNEQTIDILKEIKCEDSRLKKLLKFLKIKQIRNHKPQSELVSSEISLNDISINNLEDSITDTI